MREFSESSLRMWFRENTDEKFRSCEAEFIAAAKDVSRSMNINKNSGSHQDEDWLYDSVPRAEIAVGNVCIRLEDLFLDLVRVFLCSGGADLIVGKETSLVSLGVNLVCFAKDACQYFSVLSPAEQDFYRYLVLNFYSYSDRINAILYPASSGFSLDDALEQYVTSHRSENSEVPVVSHDSLRAAAEEAARDLQEKKILQKEKDGSWHISF